MIAPIPSIGSAQLAATTAPVASSGAGAAGGFGQVLQGTISTLESMNQDAGSSIQKFLTGENEDIHTAVLATQKASMAFDLGLQVRNKVVSAYQEIMKMQM